PGPPALDDSQFHRAAHHAGLHFSFARSATRVEGVLARTGCGGRHPDRSRTQRTASRTRTETGATDFVQLAVAPARHRDVSGLVRSAAGRLARTSSARWLSDVRWRVRP